MKEIIIEEVSYENLNEVLELFVISDPKHIRSRKFYEWRNFKSPFGRSYSYIIRINNKVIAHYSLMPIELLYKNKKIRAVYSQQAVVHPEHRNLKNIVNLATFVENKIKDKFDYIIGFPNNNFYLIEERFMKWKKISRVKSKKYNISYILSNTKKSFEDSNLIKIKNIKPFLDSISKARIQINNNLYTINNTCEYIMWRYFDNPKNYYTVFQYKDSKNSGYIVIKLYYNSINNETTAHIIQLFSDNEVISEVLFLNALKYIKNNLKVDYIMQWAFGGSFITKYLEQFVHESDGFSVNFYGKSFSEQYDQKSFFSADNWNIEEHFSDAY
jgi:hypothetical protein